MASGVGVSSLPTSASLSCSFCGRICLSIKSLSKISRFSHEKLSACKGLEDDPNMLDNLRFYTGEIECVPDGACIDEILLKWHGDYRFLERHQGFIQWLFPTREKGMNCQAQTLQLHEAQAIQTNPLAHRRVLKAYEMMLDFYGMRLQDDKTGKLERSDNWQKRFEYLNWSSNNLMRITRILKSLEELGYEYLKKSFVQMVLIEGFEHGTLDRTLKSCCNYWVGTIKKEDDRVELYDYIDNHMRSGILETWDLPQRKC